MAQRLFSQRNPDLARKEGAKGRIRAFIDRIRSKRPIVGPPVARTGDLRRTVPQIRKWGTKDGRVICTAHRQDSISIRDYDRARWYPPVRDALKAIRRPLSRMNFHFVCAGRPEIAELANQVLKDQIPSLLRTLVKGKQEFGYQVVEPRWVAKFDVAVTSSQGDGTANREYPWVWTIKRWAALSPEDIDLQVYDSSGDFAGVKQNVSSGQDIPARKLIYFSGEQDFDNLHGVPDTKAAIPFIEIAESVWDDMTRFSRRFSLPWAVGHHPMGKTRMPSGEEIDNSTLMVQLLAAAESGQSLSLPSQFDQKTGNAMWILELMQPPPEGAQGFVEKLKFCHEVIRIATAVPEMATSSSPETGTYNLGEVQIDAFLTNIEDDADELARVINVFLATWTAVNFGADAPPCEIVMEPTSLETRKALLLALLNLLQTGIPVMDAEGNEYMPDWLKVADESGLPLKAKNARSAARSMVEAITKRLEGMGGAAPEDQAVEGGNDPDDGELAKPAQLVDRESYTPVRLKSRTPRVRLFDESEHPRNADGTFKTKEQMAEETSAREPYSEWASGLREDEADSLLTYGSSSYHSINRQLRGESEDEDGYAYDAEQKEWVAGEVKMLDHLLESAPRVTEPQVVHRTVTGGPLMKASEGDTITDPAYLSTSSTPQSGAGTFEYYAKADGHQYARVAYELPAGQKALSLQAVWDAKRPKNTVDEQEILLPRGQSWKVKSVSTGADGVRDVTMVPANEL